MTRPLAPILLKAKLTYPALKETLIPRDRLLTAIKAGLKGRLTLVCAPAGFGKTTLITQWAHSQQQAPAWLSLDEMDNDLVRFWRYVIHALTAIVPEPLVQQITQLIEALPNVSINTFLDALLNELYSLSETAVLILDDYQWIQNEQIHSSLSYFIDYLPQPLHVLIASRNELPFPTVKWLTREEYHFIDVSQLQFTPSETAMFFQASSSGSGLSPAKIEQLTLRTEGWITALKLISLNLRADTQISRFLLEFKGNHRDVAEYLFHEVVSKLPADIVHFLLQTSVLDRMDAILCNAVTQATNSVQLLEQLKRLNLFVIPLDNQNSWFRYHHLFAQYLQELAKKNHSELWYRSNRLASTCYSARGYMDEAIHHAIAAENFDLMQMYLERHLPTVLNKGELATLLHWFQSIPAETKISPELSLHYAFVLVLTGQLGQVEQKLESIERISTTMEQTERWEQLQSGILFVRSNLVFLNGDYGRWFAFAEGILDRILPANPTYYNFNYNTTEPLVRRTAIGLKGILSRDTETIGNMFMGVLESHGWQESLINLYVKQSLFEGYYEWNRLDQCRELLPVLKRTAMRHQIPGLLIPLSLTQARIHIAEGRVQLAHDVLDEALLLVCNKVDIHWIEALRACKVRMYVQEGQISQAKKEMAQIGLTVKDKPTFNKEFQFVTLCRLLVKQQKETEALRLLEQLWHQSEREQLHSSLVEISNLQALLEAQRGQRSAALQYVHKALVIGEQFGYIRSFLDEGTAMAELLSAYLSEETELGPSGGVSEEYVRMLLGLFPKVSKPYAPSAPLLTSLLTRRENNLLRLIQQGASNKQIAATLALSEGTVRIYLSRLYEKLGVSSRTQALIAAQDMRLLD